MDIATGGPLGTTAAAGGGGGSGFRGGGGASCITMSIGFHAFAPSVNSRSSVTNPSRSRRTRYKPGFRSLTTAVPAGPVVYSPVEAPDTDSRTPSRLPPCGSFTEIRTDVGLAAGAAVRLGAVPAGVRPAVPVVV